MMKPAHLHLAMHTAAFAFCVAVVVYMVTTWLSMGLPLWW